MKWYSFVWLIALLVFIEHPNWPLGLLLVVATLAWMTWPRWWPKPR